MNFPTTVYVASIEPLYDKSKYDKWYNCSLEYRRVKTDKYKNEPDRIRSVAAGALLSIAYKDIVSKNCLGLDFKLPNIATSQKGKPYFVECDIKFNLSHSGDKVFCALSQQEVGCDVEYKTDDTLRIAKRFFTQKEYEVIAAGLNKKEQQKLFSLVWTLKESVLKAIGTGLLYPMNEFDVIDEDGNVYESIKLTNDERTLYLKSYDLSDDYSYSCCGLHKTFQEHPIIIEL